MTTIRSFSVHNGNLKQTTENFNWEFFWEIAVDREHQT